MFSLEAFGDVRAELRRLGVQEGVERFCGVCFCDKWTFDAFGRVKLVRLHYLHGAEQPEIFL